VQYLVLAAERHGFGLATKRAVYERLTDYETVLFRVEADGTLAVANPSDRVIAGLMVSGPGPIAAIFDDGIACIHIVNGTTFTLPPLASKQTVRLKPTADACGLPVISQPNTTRLEIVSAVHRPDTAQSEVTVRAIGRSNLLIERSPGPAAEVVIRGMGDEQPRRYQADDGTLVIPIETPADARVKLQIAVRHER
jgi:hypothetical protein